MGWKSPTSSELPVSWERRLLPNFTADSTFSCEFVHKQPNVNVGTIVCRARCSIPLAGERRIRVNIAMPTTSVEKDIFESIKVDALCNVMLRARATKLFKVGWDGRSALQNDCGYSTRTALLQHYGDGVRKHEHAAGSARQCVAREQGPVAVKHDGYDKGLALRGVIQSGR